MSLPRRALGYLLGFGFLLLLAYIVSLIGSPLSDATDAAQGRTIAAQRHITDPRDCRGPGRPGIISGCVTALKRSGFRGR